MTCTVCISYNTFVGPKTYSIYIRTQLHDPCIIIVLWLLLRVHAYNVIYILKCLLIGKRLYHVSRLNTCACLCIGELPFQTECDGESYTTATLCSLPLGKLCICLQSRCYFGMVWALSTCPIFRLDVFASLFMALQMASLLCLLHTLYKNTASVKWIKSICNAITREVHIFRLKMVHYGTLLHPYIYHNMAQ